MSSYNNIEKIKYTKNQQDVVALKEYIIFDDEMKKDKHIVFKFINNLNQNLYEIKFEVCQYDENENLIAHLNQDKEQCEKEINNLNLTSQQNQTNISDKRAERSSFFIVYTIRCPGASQKNFLKNEKKY